MKRLCTLALAAFVLSAPAGAQVPTPAAPSAAAPRDLGPPESGLSVILEPDGRISVSARRTIVLSDGREIRQGEDGRWTLTPESLAEPRQLSALDFALYADELEGQRVRVTGGRIAMARVREGSLALQGGNAALEFGRVGRDILRALVQRCSSIMTGADCDATVTGTVLRSFGGGQPRLAAEVIDAPRLR